MKTTKKFLSIILSIIMLISAVPVAFAADTTLSVGDQFEADLTKQGSDNLTFRYVFEVLSLPDAENEYGKLELVRPAEGVYPTVLKIAMLTPKITYDGVTFEITSIGDMAFDSGNAYPAFGRELQEVNLMLGTVENIGTEAFADCKKLEEVILAPNVSKFVIGEKAFDLCRAITSLHIQAHGASPSVEIGQGAFSTCTGLKELDLGSTVSKLGVGAFIGCESLTTVTFGGNKLTEIPGWCFAYTAIESIAIPEGVTAITGEVAFYECNSLKSVELPSTMETVVDGAFYNCPLERVVFKGGETVEFVGGYPLPLLTVENGYGDGLYANGQEITITANQKEGYEFVNWEIAEGDGTLADASAAETTFTMGSRAVTITPVYEEIRTECDKGNHKFVNYVKSAEASCGVNAMETSKCENCEVTDTREIEGSALSHSFTKYEEVEAPKCGVVGKEVAVCDNGCDATDEKDIPALTHEPLDAVVENEVYATCKAEGGYDLVVYCNLCGEEIDSEHITTQKLPHTPSGWWATTETEHYKHCVNDSCDEEIEGTRAAHTYTWKVTTEATATTDGVETGTCECGYETTRVIPATGETPDPEPDISDEPEDPSENCDHLCHKSGFLGFIWKIVNFFCKLFKINPVCECGAAHY